MRSLSGSFRVTRQEVQIMNALRLRGRTVKSIAMALGRSTSTIAAWTQKSVDNRNASPRVRTQGRIAWLSDLSVVRMKCSLFLKGLANTVNEALDCRVVPVAAVAEALKANENSDGDDSLDPA